MVEPLVVPAKDFPDLKQQLLFLSGQEDYFTLLDSGGFKDPYGRFDWIAAGGQREVFIPDHDLLEHLRALHEKKPRWLFGHLNYNLKNELEELSTNHPDRFFFPLMLFYEPEWVIYQKGSRIYMEGGHCTSARDLTDWLSARKSVESAPDPGPVILQEETSRLEYLKHIHDLKAHLQWGNIYEINYCVAFNASASLAPVQAFQKLQHLSPAPFAAYYKCKDQYLLCSSPERYLAKRGTAIISQPIKGTAARAAHPAQDQQLKEALLHSQKERAENVMIVDLVRNDLSRTARKGTVKVEELFGIYSYPAVHQMVSTVTSRLDPRFHFTEVLKDSFPMGSMTGAPKIRAMQLIDQFESFSRSLYSGTVGYIDPRGNFDFNVVIRSILYNARHSYVSARVGSAITVYCDAEKEYEECLLKAEKLFKALA